LPEKRHRGQKEGNSLPGFFLLYEEGKVVNGRSPSTTSLLEKGNTDAENKKGGNISLERLPFLGRWRSKIEEETTCFHYVGKVPLGGGPKEENLRPKVRLQDQSKGKAGTRRKSDRTINACPDEARKRKGSSGILKKRKKRLDSLLKRKPARKRTPPSVKEGLHLRSREGRKKGEGRQANGALLLQ